MPANRLMDGLGGALARQAMGTDAGGFSDICLDFLFHSGVVAAFVFSNPQTIIAFMLMWGLVLISPTAQVG